MSVQITGLTAEHHYNGFGIFTDRPRLSWRFAPSSVQDWEQASYTLKLTRGEKTEEYHVASQESVLVPWPSAPLSSREIVDVHIQITGTDGSVTDWASLRIETALLQRSDWKASLISGPPQSSDEPKQPFRLRKTFNCSSVEAGRLYVTSHGVYQIEINGKVVGNELLAPGWQSYKHRLHYQTHDVSTYLSVGENVIGAYLAEGWFAGRLGRPGVSNIWGDRLGILAQLEIAGHTVCVSDSTWDYLSGPILAAEIYNGEIYDSTLEDSTWSTITPATQAIGQAHELEFPTAHLIAPDVAPVRRIMEVKPQEIIRTPSGKIVLDFGQNLVGWLKIMDDIPGQKGDELVIKHAEVMEHGELGTRPLRTAKAQAIVKLGGKTKGWEPRFSWFGFRYAEISGYDEVTLSSFVAIVISSDLRRTGTFECSHDAINRLHENTVWSMRGNFVSVPTDCPQRDERLGWTGDIQVFAPTANYLFDTSAFLSSWLQDVKEDQRDANGVVPNIVPAIPWPPNHPEKRPMAVWADCSILTPWDLYNAYGDRAILARQWESMRLWLDKGIPRDKNSFYSGATPQYGDWLDPRSPPSLPGHCPTDPFLVANAYLIHVTKLASTIGNLIGESEAARVYEADANRLLELFRSEYITTSGRLSGDTQASYIIGLLFSLFESATQIETAKARLDWLIRWDAFKITTGFAGTPAILPVLADNDMLSHAYRMLQERDCPSWLYPVGMGATTIWERWNSMLPDGSINPGQMTSFNHYALGSVCAFLHKYVGGLSCTSPGWKTALIAPRPGGTVTSAKTAFDSPYGQYEVNWQIEFDGDDAEGKKVGEEEKQRKRGKKGTMVVDVTIPPNTKARVVLGEGKEAVDKWLGSGEYNFRLPWVEDEKWHEMEIIQGPQGNQIESHFVP